MRFSVGLLTVVQSEKGLGNLWYLTKTAMMSFLMSLIFLYPVLFFYYHVHVLSLLLFKWIMNEERSEK